MDSEWTGWDETLATNAALYHFRTSWAEALRHNAMRRLDSPEGFLEFCADAAHYVHFRTDTTLREWGTTEKLLRLETLLRMAESGEKDLADPSDAFLATVQEGFQHVSWESRLEREAGIPKLRHHAFIHGWHGVYALLATLLIDPAYRKLIAQCRFPPCSRFFVREGVGRPEQYCSPQHRDDDVASLKRRQRAEEILRQTGHRDETKVERAVLAAAREHPDEKRAQALASYAKQHLPRKRK
jgi:hypothetical protein